MLLALPLLLILLPVLAVARWAVARALGMRQDGFFFGRIEDPRAAPWRGGLVVAAGAFATYLVPALLFTLALLAGGKATLSTEVTVLPGRPAEAAGMRTGDRVRSVAGRPMAEWEDLKKGIGEHAGSPVEVVVDRGGEEVRLTVTPEGAPGDGKIGVAAAGQPQRAPVGIGAAIGHGIAMPAESIRDLVRGLVELIAGAPDDLSGPVGIVREAAKAQPNASINALNLVAGLFALVWPFAALVAVVTVPRRAKARG